MKEIQVKEQGKKVWRKPEITDLNFAETEKTVPSLAESLSGIS